MLRIPPRQLIGLAGQAADVFRKLAVAVPEPPIGAVPHRSVERPARRSSSAWSARASRRPAATSSSIRRSHASASLFGKPRPECGELGCGEPQNRFLDLLYAARPLQLALPGRADTATLPPRGCATYIVNGIAIPQGNKRFRAYRLLSTEPRALASGLLQAAWRPLANARGSVPGCTDRSSRY